MHLYYDDLLYESFNKNFQSRSLTDTWNNPNDTGGEYMVIYFYIN